jgi:hypothetical protein
MDVIESENGTYKASTDVVNKDRKIKRLGQTLWEISLKLIQKFADELGVSVTHEVFRMRSRGLSQDKWDELFIPLLKKYRYIKRGDDIWELSYFPHKK